MASQHTSEFRQEAVRVALTSGLSRKQVAADFGVGFSTLCRWIQMERQTLPEPTAQSDLEAEELKELCFDVGHRRIGRKRYIGR